MTPLIRPSPSTAVQSLISSSSNLLGWKTQKSFQSWKIYASYENCIKLKQLILLYLVQLQKASKTRSESLSGPRKWHRVSLVDMEFSISMRASSRFCPSSSQVRTPMRNEDTSGQLESKVCNPIQLTYKKNWKKKHWKIGQIKKKRKLFLL